MKNNIVFFIIIILIFILPISLLYSQQNPTNLKNLTHKSEIILTGKVHEKESNWNKNKTMIYTDVTIEVDEYIKGQNSEKSITVRHPGGEVGEIGELYTHMPRFNDAEEVLLFVKKDRSENNYKIVDGENGKLSILTDKQNGVRMTSSRESVKKIKDEIKRHLRN